MSVDDKREEAEALLDSAEMLLDTYGGSGKAARKLRSKISELEQQLQEPESDGDLESLVEEIKELMEQIKQKPDEDPVGMGGGMGEGGIGRGDDMMGPDDDAPPF